MLGGWLHRHTCFVAANTMRGERRRQSRERQAVEMNALQDNSGTDFSLVAPILDEAINELGEADRTAVLLRFFEQRDFRSVGEALGSNEDAARMRVTRALEKLQGLLKRRGVTTSATTLSVVLSAHAVQVAPVGLAVTISTAAVLAGTTIITTATAIKTIAMTTLQKTIIGATLAVAVGAGVYEARQASTLREQNQTLKEQQAPLAEQIQQLQRERDEATNRLAGLLAENSKLKSNPERNELLKLRGEVGVLRNQASPELKEKLSSQAEFIRDDDYRLSRASLFMTDLMGNAYGTGAGKLPADFNQFTNILREDGNGGAFFEQVVLPELERFDFFNFGTDVFIHDARGTTLNPEFKHRLVICREKFPRQGPDGIWRRIYGVVDLGNNLMNATSNDANFDSWEKEHVIFTRPTQK
jgi:hypothetical protein